MFIEHDQCLILYVFLLQFNREDSGAAENLALFLDLTYSYRVIGFLSLSVAVNSSIITVLCDEKE